MFFLCRIGLHDIRVSKMYEEPASKYTIVETACVNCGRQGAPHMYTERGLVDYNPVLIKRRAETLQLARDIGQLAGQALMAWKAKKNANKTPQQADNA